MRCWILPLIAVVMLMGCTDASPEATDAPPTGTVTIEVEIPSNMPTREPTHIPTVAGTNPMPTKTLVLSVTAPSTEIPTDGPTPTLPFIEGSFFDLREVLFGVGTDECKLPCWQNLEIGKSTPSEGIEVFDRLFGVNPHIETTNTNRIASLYYQWFDSNSGQPLFDLRMLFEPNESLLISVGIGLSPTRQSTLKVDVSPQVVLQELGTPQHILIAAEDLIGASGLVRLMLLYEQGIAYLVEKETPMDGIITELCLDSAQESISETIFIIPAITSFDELKTYWVLVTYGNTKDVLSDMLPLEDVMGYSSEEVTDLANDQVQLCLYPR